MALLLMRFHSQGQVPEDAFDGEELLEGLDEAEEDEAEGRETESKEASERPS